MVQQNRRRDRQHAARAIAGGRWVDHDLVFASEVGTELDSANVRRGFRRVAAAAGLDAADWTPRELRHSFVSLLSDEGVPIEQIARLVGHTGGSTVTDPARHGSCSVGYSLQPRTDDRPGPELR